MMDNTGTVNTGELMGRVQAEIQAQNVREIATTINDKCFAKCITRPSSSLSSSEQSCLARCMDCYIESIGLVMKVLSERSPE